MLRHRLIQGFFSLIVFLLLGQTKPVLSADRVVLSVPVLGEFTVSRESLEQFAEDGTISPDLELYTRFLSEEDLIIFRVFLQQRFDLDPVVLSRFTQVGMGETLLKRIGELILMEGNTNGFYGLRSALVLAAFEKEEGTILSIIRHFPRQEVHLDISEMLALWQQFTALSDYTQTSVVAIAQQANREAQAETWQNLAQLDDLRKMGQYKTQKQTFTFDIEEIRQTNQGLSPLYPLEVDFYLPIDAPTSAPLVIISHGFGSYQGNYEIAYHLASYGFAVAVPRHIGSDLAYRESFFKGELRVILSPTEFISRPHDVTNLLDELEELAKRDTEWVKQIDLEKVGIIGHSLGGSTALSLAGANINLERLKQDCEEKNHLLNFSLLLQCRGIYLPPGDYQLKDTRIKAML
ncbi:MAG: alpha/beta hydrolase, partial [Microcystaceae cyanobacterium]